MIARLNVTSVVSAVRIAEYKPTRFEVAVNDSVPTSGLSSLVISTYLSITSSYTTAHRSALRFSFESSLERSSARSRKPQRGMSGGWRRSGELAR